MIRQLAVLLFIIILVGCGEDQPQSFSAVPRVPLHRLLLFGQQNINNLSVIQSLKDHVESDPLFENVFDEMSVSEYNRMSAMLDQHLLGFFSLPGDEFVMDPDRSDFFAITIELTGYTVKLDTNDQERVWYSSNTIDGTWILNKDVVSATCPHQHDSLTLHSNQFHSQIVQASYTTNEGQGCQMNCSATYSYTVKIMDDDRKILRQKEIMIPFNSWVILPDE